jgi:hypothetical protein
MDCFSSLAMTAVVVFDSGCDKHRHCEERSDEAIHLSELAVIVDCFTALAMTN